MRDFTDRKVTLNLNLLIDELKDFITKIKENYDDNKSSIKTKRELLEEEIEKPEVASSSLALDTIYLQ